MSTEFTAVGIVYFPLEQNLWKVIKHDLKR